MADLLEVLRRRPKVSEVFFKSARDITRQPEMEYIFSWKEGNELFVQLIRIQELPSPENGVLTGTIHMNKQEPVPFAFRVSNPKTFTARSILIPPPLMKDYPDEQLRLGFTLHTDPQGKITLIHLQYTKSTLFVYVEYNGEEWGLHSDPRVWREQKAEVLEILEQAITKAEEELYSERS